MVTECKHVRLNRQIEDPRGRSCEHESNEVATSHTHVLYDNSGFHTRATSFSDLSTSRTEMFSFGVPSVVIASSIAGERHKT